jgi:amino-acid N-acetyltransferase
VESNTSQIIIREAIRDDLEAIRSLLDSVSLPSVDIEKHLSNFFVLQNEAEIIGTIGMELYGDTVLLRSLAVKKDFQNKYYGQRLCKRLISKARKLDVINIYLLTEAAVGFFSKEGFQKIGRDVVPPVIRQTYEFSTLCPESAFCMVKKLKEWSE